jgi:hypothetical protein
MKINSSFKSISFLYDFAKYGGAVSTIGMGIYLPNNYKVIGTCIFPLIDLVSNSTTLVSIGTTSNVYYLVDDTTNGGSSKSQIDYNNLTYGFFTKAFNGRNTMAFMNPGNLALINNNVSEEVVIDISGDFLTAGSFSATILYLEF